MTETYTGGCACGAIRYSCTGKPLYMGNCHCRDCQRATGSAFFPTVLFKGDDFNLEKGPPVGTKLPLTAALQCVVLFVWIAAPRFS